MRKRYAKFHTTITQPRDPTGISSDPPTDVLRDCAHKLIEQMIQAEQTSRVISISGEGLENGQAHPVRHGHLPDREKMPSIDPV